MKEKVNVAAAFTAITDYFSPRVIGEVNDVYIKLAVIKGDDVPWHSHDDEDELFYVVDGSMMMAVKGRDAFPMGPGDMFVVERGTEHRVYAEAECRMMLIENKTTAHTGGVESHITKSIDQQKY